ncbi:hypothetical protein K7432_015815 [Basidiobolus ranarum]|uniref:HSF-type DNA-binding domain-containing protein n=1 Tax=Basidiobolus ranarum TaxID=34480 RepID=A0ABR2VMJ5_9FUNG
MNANLSPMLDSMDTQIPPQSKEIPVFVRKLYRMLDNERHAEYIRWNSSGNSFVIPDGPLLAAVVLPKFFKASTFSSFVRQLNNYEFRRISDARKAKNPSSQLASVFTHPNFQRGKYNQLHLIKRSVNRAARVKSKIHSNSSEKGDEEILLPHLIGGLDCSSSESEDSGELVENQTEHCANCQSLNMEVQVLRQRLRSYEDIFATNAEHSLSIEQKNRKTSQDSTKHPQAPQYPVPQPDSSFGKTENWTIETANQEFEIFSKLSWMYSLESPTLNPPQPMMYSFCDTDVPHNHSWNSCSDNGFDQSMLNWNVHPRAEDRKCLDATQITDVYPFL